MSMPETSGMTLVRLACIKLPLSHFRYAYFFAKKVKICTLFFWNPIMHCAD